MKTIVSLSGGLGNQLFQIAAASNYSANSKVFFEQQSHNPELGRDEMPIILDFNFSEKYKIVGPVRILKLAARANSLILRLSLKEDAKLLDSFFRALLKRLIQIYLLLRFRRYFKTVIPTSAGTFNPDLILSNRFLNGYFQNCKVMFNPHIREFIFSIKPKDMDTVTLEWIKKAKREKPIILHYRLGDYKHHPKMGVLDTKYFVGAIEQAKSYKSDSPIWVFSDDPGEAISLLQAAGLSNLIEAPDLGPVQTLELMRFGTAYVISNSTFSWWAATLRYDQNAKVWAPDPWFKDQTSPESIYGRDWKLIGAWTS